MSIFASVEKLWDISAGCDFFGLSSCSRLFLSMCVFYKTCNHFLSKSFLFFVWFFKDISMFWNHTSSLRSWVGLILSRSSDCVKFVARKSRDLCIVSFGIWFIYFQAIFLIWFLVFFLNSLNLFFFLFDHCESVLFFYMIFSSNCLKLQIVKSSWHKKLWNTSIKIHI